MSGAEMELREIMEGELRRLEARVFVERCRERVWNMDEVRWELDPEGVGR